MANVIFKNGLRANYDAITKDALTFYRVQETNGKFNLYLGEMKISNDDDVQEALRKIGVNETAIGTNKTDIAKLREDLNKLTGDSSESIQSLLDNLEGRLNNAIQAVDTKAETNKTAIANEVTRAQSAEGALDTKITELTTLVNQNETDIEAKVSAHGVTIGQHTNTLDNHEGRIGSLESKDTELAGAIATEKGRIDKLVGSDADTSVRAIAAEEVAKIVDGAPESYDTLKEIADWITNDTTGAADMANDIKALQQTAENHGTLLTTQGEAIDALEEALDKADTGIKARLTNAEAAIGENAKDITANANAIDAINHSTTGILAQAKSHAQGLVDDLSDKHDDDMLAVDGKFEGVNKQIEDIDDAIEAINDADDGILAQATALIEQLRGSLKSAAYEDATAFDASGSADQALADAKEYTDGKFDAAKAYTDSCLTWQSIS